jgi:oxygen-independent coproporphyrinogen-3 oxidase
MEFRPVPDWKTLKAWSPQSKIFVEERDGPDPKWIWSNARERVNLNELKFMNGRNIHVDLELVKKYNVPGPRYTSYPPATHFTEETPYEAVREKIVANNETNRDLSIYYHLPFCRSLCWYCGCTTVITTQQAQSTSYLGYLKKEMDLMGAMLNPQRKVVQLHFGGGTPTFLTPEELRTLGGMIHDRFTFAPDAEAGVEIDPRGFTEQHVVALREIGFNRASLGVQDNDPTVQAAVHRIQPFAMTRQSVDWLRENGFKSINIDLIYGLPFQSAASFEKTLDEVLQLNPDRFAIFSYAHVPSIKPAQRIFKEGTLPSAEVKMQLLKLCIEKLSSAGYVYIGMDHFSRVDDELAVAQSRKTLRRNFQGYSTRGNADIYSFGMSSISQTDCAYWQNTKDLPAYYAALNENKIPYQRGYVLTDEDKVRRQTIMRLMCDLELDYALMSEFLELDFAEHYREEINSLADMEEDGLVKRNSRGLEVTELGRLLIRNIAMRFDAYQSARKGGSFSRTI